MKRLGIAFVLSAFAFALLPGSASSQQKNLKDQIVGSWTLVLDAAPTSDGSKHQRFGSSPKALNTF